MNPVTNLAIINNINLCSPIHKLYKENILYNFTNSNKDLAAQGSAEWLNMRVYNIGGSEMSTITGDNPYSKLDQLVAQKVGFHKFSGNIATNWGKLFEQATQQITEIIFDTSIKETGSIEGVVKNQRYSPDGLSVIKMLCSGIIDNNEVECEEYNIVLFEFKSPLYSIPNGFIPKHYLPQVKTGLCSIPLTDFAIYISNMFRKCSFDNLNTSSTYDTNFHNKDHKHNLAETKPLAFGMILFYQTREQQISFYEKYKNLIKNIDVDDADDADDEDEDSSANAFKFINKSSIIMNIYEYVKTASEKKICKIKDFGNSYYGEFNNILQLFNDGFLSVKYCIPHILEEYNNNIFLAAQNKKMGSNDYMDTLADYKNIIKNGTIKTGENIIGYLPWKLMISDIIYEPREEMYVAKYNDIIQNTMSIVQKINDMSSQADKVNMFKSIYPKSRILKDNGLDHAYNMYFMPQDIDDE